MDCHSVVCLLYFHRVLIERGMHVGIVEQQEKMDVERPSKLVVVRHQDVTDWPLWGTDSRWQSHSVNVNMAPPEARAVVTR